MCLSTLTATLVAAASASAFTLGAIIGRLPGCAQCRAVRDQDMTLVRRLLGDREELQPFRRHRLRRNRPYTATEILALLEANKALLTPQRWQEIEAQRNTWAYRELMAGRWLEATTTSEANAATTELNRLAAEANEAAR